MPAERRGNGRGAGVAAGPRPAHVYDRLKDAIITGMLRPLERISENKVAADFGLSRTPVRRWAQPSEFEKVAVFLADPSLSFHTGETMVVDGGYSVF